MSGEKPVPAPAAAGKGSAAPPASSSAAPADAAPEKESPFPYPTRRFMANEKEFVIDRRYDPEQVLGEGAYGIVVLCKDYKAKKRGAKLAIKKTAFNVNKSFRGMALRTLREIYILRHLDHPNLLTCRDLMPPVSRADFDSIYCVLDALDTDLRRIIRSKQKLENVDCQILMYQIFRAMNYFHKSGLIHRDIKPSNILVNADLTLKICDFGLSRGIPDEEGTEYVVTRHYRAPEVMVNPKHYDNQIDIWSVGCVMAELLSPAEKRDVLFNEKDALTQLKRIIQVIGSPSEEELEEVNVNARRYIKDLGPHKPQSFKTLIPDADPLAIDLLEKTLKWDPKKRITAEQALEHKWFSSMKQDPYFQRMKVLHTDVSPAKVIDFSWEKPSFTRQELVDLLCQEIYVFRPELKDTWGAQTAALPDVAGLSLAQKKPAPPAGPPPSAASSAAAPAASASSAAPAAASASSASSAPAPAAK